MSAAEEPQEPLSSLLSESRHHSVAIKTRNNIYILNWTSKEAKWTNEQCLASPKNKRMNESERQRVAILKQGKYWKYDFFEKKYSKIGCH